MGMSDLYGPSDRQANLATIRAALEAGVTWLDTGGFYGVGAVQTIESCCGMSHTAPSIVQVLVATMALAAVACCSPIPSGAGTGVRRPSSADRRLPARDFRSGPTVPGPVIHAVHERAATHRRSANIENPAALQ